MRREEDGRGHCQALDWSAPPSRQIGSPHPTTTPWWSCSGGSSSTTTSPTHPYPEVSSPASNLSLSPQIRTAGWRQEFPYKKIIWRSGCLIEYDSSASWQKKPCTFGTGPVTIYCGSRLFSEANGEKSSEMKYMVRSYQISIYWRFRDMVPSLLYS